MVSKAFATLFSSFVIDEPICSYWLLIDENHENNMSMVRK